MNKNKSILLFQAIVGRIFYPISIIIVFLYSIIFIFLAKVLKSFFVLRVGNSYVSRVGHLSTSNLVYLYTKNIEKLKAVKTIDIFFTCQPVSNHFLYSELKKNIKNHNGIIIEIKLVNFILEKSYFKKSEDPVWVMLKRISIYFPSLRQNIIELIPDEDCLTILETYPNLKAKNVFNLSPKFNSLEFITNKNDNIVLLFIRDPLYLAKHQPQMYLEKNYLKDINNNPRNSDFTDFQSLVEELISLNFTVIKMGVGGSIIPFDNTKFFDYSNSRLRNAETDLFLMKHCKFIIGTSSGLDNFQFYYSNKPTWLLQHGEINSIVASRLSNYKILISPKLLNIDYSDLNNFDELYFKYKNAIKSDFRKPHDKRILTELNFFIKYIYKSETPDARYIDLNNRYNIKRIIFENRRQYYSNLNASQFYSYFSASYLENIKHLLF